MDEVTARAELSVMVGMSDVPTLRDDEFDLLVSFAKVSDEFGLRPSDTGWTPTFNLNRAAARGWKWKAGKITSAYDFQTDGQRFSRAQWFEHCMAMSQSYSTGGMGTIVVGASGVPAYTDVIGNLNVG
jgi:hypothetical protein